MENNYELIGEDKHRSPIYFVPDIEDIRVGYECEIKPTGSEELDWMPYVINGDTAFKYYKTKGKGATSIRVPYLTKEQIEAEGWKSYDLSKGFAYRYGVPSFRHGFTKDNYILVLDTRKYHIEIMALDVLKIDFLPEFPEHFRVTIPCKDINTFRYICKLLKIK